MFTLSLSSFGQEPEVRKCDEAVHRHNFLDTASAEAVELYHSSRAELEEFTQRYVENNPMSGGSSESRAILYTIPVVIHIIHANGSENISNAQVMDAMEVLNRDFQLGNADANNVQPPFQGMPADIEIEFKLAKLTPGGDCTNGITRTYSTASTDPNAGGNDRINAVQAAHGNWPGDEYLNIYVAGEIGGAAGYTYKPFDWGGGSGMGNGIHVLDTYVGRIGTGSIGRSRTLTHEVGHWLNLDHLWGGSNNPGEAGNCGIDDAVLDTPETLGWTICDLDGATCDLNEIDNVENYMEYSYCSKMFTPGQKARMHAALNSSTGGRDNLSTNANLTNTGVGLPDVMCQADFQASKTTVCAGETVTFSDLSYSGPTGWTWTFPGATPGTSTDQNPTVTYTTAGVHEVILTATDGSNSDTETKTAFITVVGDPIQLPYYEGFENYSAVPNTNWGELNLEGNNSWGIANVGLISNKSAKMNNFGQNGVNTDELICLQGIDLSNVDPTVGVTLSFRYAYKKRSAGNDEWLKVFLSDDCGQTWAQRKTIHGNSLGSEISTSTYTPSSDEEWTTVHMTNVTSQFWVENFKYKFEFESDGGNNIYIDNINIYNGSPSDDLVSGLEEGDVIADMGIYPNPADNEVNVRFGLTSNASTAVEVYDMVGQKVLSTRVNANVGTNVVTLSTSNLRAGVYMVAVVNGGVKQVRQLVIK